MIRTFSAKKTRYVYSTYSLPAHLAGRILEYGRQQHFLEDKTGMKEQEIEDKDKDQNL